MPPAKRKHPSISRDGDGNHDANSTSGRVHGPTITIDTVVDASASSSVSAPAQDDTYPDHGLSQPAIRTERRTVFESNGSRDLGPDIMALTEDEAKSLLMSYAGRYKRLADAIVSIREPKTHSISTGAPMAAAASARTRRPRVPIAPDPIADEETSDAPADEFDVSQDEVEQGVLSLAGVDDAAGPQSIRHDQEVQIETDTDGGIDGQVLGRLNSLADILDQRLYAVRFKSESDQPKQQWYTRFKSQTLTSCRTLDKIAEQHPSSKPHACGTLLEIATLVVEAPANVASRLWDEFKTSVLPIDRSFEAIWLRMPQAQRQALLTRELRSGFTFEEQWRRLGGSHIFRSIMPGFARQLQLLGPPPAPPAPTETGSRPETPTCTEEAALNFSEDIAAINTLLQWEGPKHQVNEAARNAMCKVYSICQRIFQVAMMKKPACLSLATRRNAIFVFCAVVSMAGNNRETDFEKEFRRQFRVGGRNLADYVTTIKGSMTEEEMLKFGGRGQDQATADIWDSEREDLALAKYSAMFLGLTKFVGHCDWLLRLCPGPSPVPAPARTSRLPAGYAASTALQPGTSVQQHTPINPASAVASRPGDLFSFNPLASRPPSITTGPSGKLPLPPFSPLVITPPVWKAPASKRQRRKLPSCAGCRFLKVKCDATETGGCTECKKRDIPCQPSAK